MMNMFFLSSILLIRGITIGCWFLRLCGARERGMGVGEVKMAHSLLFVIRVLVV